MSAALKPQNTAPRGLRLYQLPDAFRAFDAALEDLGGELSPELEAELDRLEGTLEQRSESIATLIREHLGAADVLKAEAARLSDRAKVHVNTAERLKLYLFTTMQALGRNRIDAGRFVLAIQRNSAPSIRWAGDGEIPTAFQRVRVELDSDAAREAWKAGTLPAGFEASVGSHLRIR